MPAQVGKLPPHSSDVDRIRSGFAGPGKVVIHENSRHLRRDNPGEGERAAPLHESESKSLHRHL